MKKYPLLIALLIMLSGCAIGVYDGRGFHGVAIGVPYPYYAPSHPPRAYDGPGNRYYSQEPDRYYRGRGYPGYYR
jgi:hypothetical protein